MKTLYNGNTITPSDYFFNVDYELISDKNDIYTFKFSITRGNANGAGGLVNCSYVAWVNIENRKIVDMDKVIYTVKLLDGEDSGYTASNLLKESAEAEGLVQP